MSGAWQTLCDGGLPLALPRTRHVPSEAQLAGALCEAIDDVPSGRDADALAAYVLAWHHHWPTSFAARLGANAQRALAWADAHVGDPNRYLKLRRIALENLAHVL